MEKKSYYSVWTRDTKIWEGLAYTKYEAIDKAYYQSDYQLKRYELVAKIKK